MINKIVNFFNREQNLLIHFIATFLVVLFGIIYKISMFEWLLVIFMISLVITSELINSSIELAVDLYTSTYHPLARIAKDTAASAVLIAAISSVIVGLYIFIPKIFL